METSQSDQEMVVKHLNMSEIFADPAFNCRGEIRPIDVVNLVKSIQEVGLQTPITVRPRRESDSAGAEYVVVAGHRRHMAYVIIESPTIPCIVRAGLTDMQARTLNLIENLKRQDLNIVQEARALKPYHEAGWGRQSIAEEFAMSSGWVQVRKMILDLPPSIQEELIALNLTQAQIRDLYSLKGNPDEQFAAVKRVKEAREKNDPAIKGKRDTIKKPTAEQKRIRTKSEIEDFMTILTTVLDGPGFATRCLAWAAGNISNRDVHEALETHARENGHLYSVPDFADEN